MECVAGVSKQVVSVSRGQPTPGTGAKAKGRSGGFSNFGGLVQPRIEMTLRCAPVISILCRLGIMSETKIRAAQKHQRDALARKRSATSCGVVLGFG